MTSVLDIVRKQMILVLLLLVVGAAIGVPLGLGNCARGQYNASGVA